MASKSLAVRKSFGVARKTKQSGYIEFAVGKEEFNIPLPLPGIAVMDMVAANDESEPQKVIAAFGAFLSAAMGQDDFNRYHQAALDQRLSLEEVLEVVSFVVEAGIGVPT